MATDPKECRQLAAETNDPVLKTSLTGRLIDGSALRRT
jgi:hypothetical protein